MSGQPNVAPEMMPFERRQAAQDIAALPPTPQGQQENDLDAFLQAFSFQAQIRDQDELLQQADKGTGAPAGLRFTASQKMTDAGKLGFLQARLGADNVKPVLNKESGELENFLWREGPKAQWKLYDPPTSEGFFKDLPSDVADVGGALVEGAASAGAGAMGGSVAGPAGALVGAVGGAVVGNASRQAQSALLPGDDEMSMADRSRELTLAGSSAAVGEGVGKVVGAMAKPALKVMGRAGRAIGRGAVKAAGGEPGPSQAIADEAFGGRLPTRGAEVRGGLGQTKLEAAQEGMELQRRVSADIGDQVNLSAGQLTGGREPLGFEQLIRKRPQAAQVQHAYDTERLAQMAAMADKTIDVLADSKAVGAAEAGKRSAAAYDAMIKQLSEARAAEARQLFGAAQAAGKGQKLLPAKNTLTAIDELEASMRGWGPEESKAGQEYLAKLRADLLQASGETWAKVRGGAPTMTPMQFQSSLERWGRAARYGDSAVEKLDRPKSKRIAAAIFGALQRDMDQAIEAGGEASAAGQALRRARDAYADSSRTIDEARNALLDRALKLSSKQQSSFVPRELFGSRYSDEEVAKAFAILEKAEPETAKQLRAAALRGLVESAKGTSQSGAEEAGTLSAAKLATVLRKNERRLASMVGSQEEGARMVADLGNLSRRLSDISPLGGNSQTEPLRLFGDKLAVVKQLGRKALERLQFVESPEAVAMALNDPVKVRQLMELAAPKSDRNIYEFSRALTQFAASIARDMQDDSELPAEPSTPTEEQKGNEQFLTTQVSGNR